MSRKPIQPKAYEQLGFLGKLDLIPGIVSIFGAALYAAIAGVFRGSWGADTYKHHVTHALLRKYTARLSTAQLQYLNGSFVAIYERWCKQTGAEPEHVTFPSGCEAFWVGDKTAENIIVYFHGGGFSLEGTSGHIKFWSSVQADLASAGKPAAFLFVEYTLVPHATYPVQISEGIEALRYVLEDLGRSPSNVTLGGDSAGANLCLAILSHIMHPSSDLPPLQITKSFKALILIAPWVSFDIKQPSGERNAYKDIFKVEMGVKWGRDYLGGRQSNPYTEALLAPTGWWNGAKVEQVLVVAGADEILVDAISLWAETFKSVNPDILTCVITKNEGHIAPFIEPEFGDEAETEQGKAIRSWMKWRF